MKLMTIVIPLLLMGCGNTVFLEKIENNKINANVVTVQLYSTIKEENTRILYVSMFKSGSLSLDIDGVKMDERRDKVDSPEYNKCYDEILHISEHWMSEGNNYVEKDRDESTIDFSVDIDISEINGTSRSIRVPVTKDNFEKLKLGIVQRLDGFYTASK